MLVEPAGAHSFAGAIARPVADAAWTWIERDIAPEIASRIDEAVRAGTAPERAFDGHAEALLAAIREALAAEEADPDLARRHTIQLGGDAARRRLPYVIMAMRRRAQLAQAAQFGRGLGMIQDEAALVTALSTITIRNAVSRALWMQAMVGSMTNPGRVMAGVVRLAGGASDTALTQAGFAPLVDAVLSHAQSQLAALMAQQGSFSDYDLACRAVDRFHRLMRALSVNCELSRKGDWARIAADLTSRVSERLERPLRQISSDLTQALRRPREGADSVDPHRILAGLNGLYLLITIRKSRDSLALNTLLDQVWAETGQTLEVLVTRALEVYRKDPRDMLARERLDAGIKMAEIRYNADYADILRRARDAAERRSQAVPAEVTSQAS